jgi:putative endonuclease
VTHIRQQLGESGENLAVSELESRGYAVLARRYRTRYGEIDVIADDAGVLVFVEVRRKSAEGYGPAVESITPAKRRRVVRMAVEFLARHDLYDKCAVRFDVVAIDDQPDGEVRISVIRAAFDASGP